MPDRVAVVGEEIGLDVDLYNPLALELRVSRLQASVEASTAGSFQVADTSPTQLSGWRRSNPEEPVVKPESRVSSTQCRLVVQLTGPALRRLWKRT